MISRFDLIKIKTKHVMSNFIKYFPRRGSDNDQTESNCVFILELISEKTTYKPYIFGSWKNSHKYDAGSYFFWRCG